MVASANEVEYVLAKAPRTNFRLTMALREYKTWAKIPAQGIDSADDETLQQSGSFNAWSAAVQARQDDRYLTSI
jgi:hypothetical protein